jgi:hypothetical protein
MVERDFGDLFFFSKTIFTSGWYNIAGCISLFLLGVHLILPPAKIDYFHLPLDVDG